MASLERMRLYYARLAEHRVLDYLHINSSYLDQYEAGVMIDVASDLCNLTNAYFTSLSNLLDHLHWLSYDRFTGELQDYHIYLTGSNTGTRDLDDVTDLWISYKVESDSAKVYKCKAKVLATANSQEMFDARDVLILGGDVSVSIAIIVGGVTEHGYDTIRFSGGGINKIISLGDNLGKLHVLEIVQVMDSIYDTAWSYAKAYHQMLRGMGYTSKYQVPDDLLPIPPDIVFPTPWNLKQNHSMTEEEVMAYYLALLKAIEKFFNESSNKLAKYLSNQNFSFPDTREWLKNVIIRFPNGTIYLNVTRLIPVWYLGEQTFYPGQDNILKNPMGALVQLPNGEWRYIQLPSGYMINPALVHTPFGETTDPWTLKNYQAGFNPVYEGHKPPEPEFVKTMNEVVQLIIALMPLLILLAIMQMMVNLGKRR